MSQSTKIEWATKVWNPVTGCNKVSQGCKNCYAETVAKRFWGERKFTDVVMHEDRLHLPNWKTPQRVFVNSMSDLFHEDVSFHFIYNVWMRMYANPQHTFMILTKRPERIIKYIEWFKNFLGEFIVLPNVWLGVSVENQETANERIPLLVQVPAAVRWLSCEPLLGRVVLSHAYKIPSIDHPHAKCGPLIHWVVVGGESGAKARPMHTDWVLNLRHECEMANVPFFFKQWGEWMPISRPLTSSEINVLPKYYAEGKRFYQMPLDYSEYYKCGKAKAGRKLDGVEYNEFPKAEMI